MRRQWSAPAWAWLATATGCALFAALGTWQWQRGQDKQALLDALQSAQQRTPVELPPGVAGPPASALHRVQVSGTFDAQRQLLLDNQTRAGRAGFHVWTPLVFGDGSRVMVDRGWVAPGPDRATLPAVPAPPGPVRIEGLWRALPEPALRLEGANCPAASWPHIVQYPTVRDLGCLYDAAVADGVLLLDPAAPGGFVREWAENLVGMPPQRHYGYAVQWFALCATVLVLFIVLGFRRRD